MQLLRKTPVTLTPLSVYVATSPPKIWTADPWEKGQPHKEINLIKFTTKKQFSL